MERTGREPAQQRPETLIWGKNPVTELLKSGEPVDTVYLADTLPQAVAGYYTALAKQSGAVVKRVPGHKLQKLCATADHQGVAARGAEVQYATLEDLFAAAQAKTRHPSWCCATAWRTPTIWGPSFVPPIYAAPMA